MDPFVIFGVTSGIFFLIFLLCVIAQIYIKKRMSERYRQQSTYTAVTGSNAVSNINTQFNKPIAGPRPTFAPAENYPIDPGYHYAANLPPQFDQQHHQNFNSGAVSTYTPSPMIQPDIPPSYSQVVGRSQ